MRRFSVPVSIVAAVLLGVLALIAQPVAIAQEGTPSAEGMVFAPGVVAQPLAFAEGQDVPALYRVTFAPDAALTGGQNDAWISLVSMEAGSLTVTFAAPIAITRGGGAGTPVMGEFRNDGQEEVSLLAAAIVPSGMATPAAGTPAP